MLSGRDLDPGVLTRTDLSVEVSVLTATVSGVNERDATATFANGNTARRAWVAAELELATWVASEPVRVVGTLELDVVVAFAGAALALGTGMAFISGVGAKRNAAAATTSGTTK